MSRSNLLHYSKFGKTMANVPTPFHISMNRALSCMAIYLVVLLGLFIHISKGTLRRRFRNRYQPVLETVFEGESKLIPFDGSEKDTDLEFANLEVTTTLCTSKASDGQTFGRENWHGDGINAAEMILLSY